MISHCHPGIGSTVAFVRPCRFGARLLLVLVLSLSAHEASAQSAGSPLVVAVDASLPAAAHNTVRTWTRRLAGQSSGNRPIGLVVFDDVVLEVVSLRMPDAATTDRIELALDNAGQSRRPGNLAIGLERALAELGGQAGGRVLLFSRASTEGVNAERATRTRQWFEQILLSDAEARGVSIALVAPEQARDASLVSALTSNPDNGFFALEAGAAIPERLLAMLTGASSERAGDPIDTERWADAQAPVQTANSLQAETVLPPLPQEPDEKQTPTAPLPTNGAGWWMLVAALASVVIGLVTVVFLARFVRRYRNWQLRSASPTTESSPEERAERSSGHYLPIAGSRPLRGRRPATSGGGHAGITRADESQVAGVADEDRLTLIRPK